MPYKDVTEGDLSRVFYTRGRLDRRVTTITEIAIVGQLMTMRLLLVALLAVPIAPAAAQWGGARRIERGDRYVGGSAAASFYTNGGAHFAEIRDRNYFTANLRAEWVLETAGPFALASTLEVVPIAVVSRRAGPLRDCWTDVAGRSHCQSADARATYGSGANPLGIKLYLANESRARLFTDGSVGMLWFNRDMPIAGSRRMNFAVDYGGGVEVNTFGASAVVLGWRFQHMSNGYTSPLNPGLDVNVLYLGLLRRRR